MPRTESLPTRIVAALKGAFAAVVLATNVLVFCACIVPMALIKLALPFKPVRRVVDRVLNALASTWIRINSAWIAGVGNAGWSVTGTEGLRRNHWYLVASNHQSWVDILVLHKLPEHWLEGRWDKANVTWDSVLAEYPRDALAVQCAHLTDFYIGDAVNLRDRIARVIGHWDKETPGYSYILGMQAFGLEECNEFALAEQTALAALDIEPRDGWSVHAATHVMEMQNRFTEGEAFLLKRVEDWSPDNGLAFHNWWHLALFYLEQENFTAALKLYDDKLAPSDGAISLELVDASALLWRLGLHDHDTASRWSALAERWRPKPRSKMDTTASTTCTRLSPTLAPAASPRPEPCSTP